ncbi:MAG: carboxypeptidase regulatory-like domain-containing protein [Bacteroidia bacterium]
MDNRYISYRNSLFALLVIVANFTYAQKYSEKGDKYFDKNLFAEAIKYYLLETKSVSKSSDYAMLKLADCYRITGEFEKAEETYKKILKKKKKDAINYLNYAQSLKSSAKYAEAAVQFKEYVKLNPRDPMGKIYLQSCDSAQKWLEETIGKEVLNVESINSPLSDFAPVFASPDELVFSSSRIGSTEALISFNGGMEIHRLDLYRIEVSKIDNKSKTELANFNDVNSPLHEGAATFSKNGKEIYFSRTVKGKRSKDAAKVVNTLQVFYSSQDSLGKWSKPISAFSFNSQDYSVGQPSLSNNGDTIYFMSDMPGGYGNTDIYYCVKQKDGNWSAPVNVGNEINTFGHELFPYLSQNGTLFFSSDTHPGMGQLDIFSARRNNNKWSGVTNLKPPINSIANDFGIALDEKYMRGFFSSDRFNGKGAEDIYSFSDPTPLKLTINGGLIQFPDKSIFDGIKYKLIDEKTKAETVLEPKGGIYTLSLNEMQNYTLVAKKNGFSYNRIALSLTRDTLGNYLEAKVKPIMRAIKVNGAIVSTAKHDSLHKELPLENIQVSLIDSTTIIEKAITAKKGFFEFNQELNPNEPYTIVAKVVVVKDPPDPIINCKGIVSYKDLPIPEASVQLSENGILLESVVTNAKGEFNFVLDPSKSYKLLAFRSGYDSSAKFVTTALSDVKNGISLNLPLDSLGSIKLNGLVTDDAGPLKNAQVVIREGKKIIAETRSGEDGRFTYPLSRGSEYSVTTTANGYIQKEVVITTKDPLETSFVNAVIKLDSIRVNSVIVIENLYYNYDKPDVQASSFMALDKLVAFMNANPTVVIELSAHTDTRGNPDYNLKLSQARAQNAKDYLTVEDIDPSRVIPVGYGRNKPIIVNAKTEKEHQLNRRTEIKILKKQ